LVSTEFAINNKVYSATKMLPFMANYERELRIRIDIRRIGKIEKVMELTEEIKEVQEEVGAALKKIQEKMKQQANKERKEAEVWKAENEVIRIRISMTLHNCYKLSHDMIQYYTSVTSYIIIYYKEHCKRF